MRGDKTVSNQCCKLIAEWSIRRIGLSTVATLVLALTGCASAPPVTWDLLYNPVKIPAPRYGLDYSYGDYTKLHPWLNETLPVNQMAFVARYISSESDSTRGKLLNLSAEKEFLKSTPILPIAIPKSGSEHSLTTGIEAGNRTVDQLVSIVGLETLKKHTDGLAIFLNVETKGRLPHETDLSISFYLGWAYSLKKRGGEIGVRLEPAVYISANPSRAMESWRALSVAYKENEDLRPVAIWAARSRDSACEEVFARKYEQRWFNFYDSLKAGDLKSLVIANQFAINCHRNNDTKDLGFDLSVINPDFDFDQFSRKLLRPFPPALQ